MNSSRKIAYGNHATPRDPTGILRGEKAAIIRDEITELRKIQVK